MSSETKRAAIARTCGQHGQYLATHIFGEHFTRCPTCMEEAAREERARDARREQEARDSDRRRRLRASGLTGRQLQQTFEAFVADTPDKEKSKSIVQRFATGISAGEWAALLIVGPTGTGKTHLAAAACLKAIDAGHHAQFLSGGTLGRQVRATWARSTDVTEVDLIARWAGVDLLVLDEVGLTAQTEFEERLLHDVVDQRYVAGRPVLITSNLRLDDLRAHLGERCWDRLRENGRAVVCEWESHRGTAA